MQIKRSFNVTDYIPLWNEGVFGVPLPLALLVMGLGTGAGIGFLYFLPWSLIGLVPIYVVWVYIKWRKVNANNKI
jgi:hypothetical protein